MARLNGAGINDPAAGGPEPAMATGRGLLSSLARAQYSALAHLRWRIFINGLRSNLGAFELGARTVSFVMYTLMGLAFGFGAGAGRNPRANSASTGGRA